MRISRSTTRECAPFVAIVAAGAALLPAAARLGAGSAHSSAVSAPIPGSAALAAPRALPKVTVACRNSSTLAGLFGEGEPAPALRGVALPAPSTLPIASELAPDPLADYRMTGVITVDGKRYALLENMRTSEGVYLAEGEQLQGMTVAKVTANSVEFDEAQSRRQIALNEDYSFTAPTTPSEPEKTQAAQQTAEAAHSDSILISGTRVLTNYIDMAIISRTGVDVEKMKDDVFEGKMSVDEFNQKTQSGAALWDWADSGRLTNNSMIYYRTTVTQDGLAP